MNLVNTCFLADSIIAYALGWMNELSGGVFLSCFAINDTRSLRNGEFTWALGGKINCIYRSTITFVVEQPLAGFRQKQMSG